MAKKRALRERGTSEERKAQYSRCDDLNTVVEEEEQNTDVKKQKTEDTRKRWTLPSVPSLAPLPAPGVEPEESILEKCMGFSSFSTTKGMHVFGNQDGPLPPKRKRRQYRQLLHVKGIYDVPLTRDQISGSGDSIK